MHYKNRGRESHERLLSDRQLIHPCPVASDLRSPGSLLPSDVFTKQASWNSRAVVVVEQRAFRMSEKFDMRADEYHDDVTRYSEIMQKVGEKSKIQNEKSF